MSDAYTFQEVSAAQCPLCTGEAELATLREKQAAAEAERAALSLQLQDARSDYHAERQARERAEAAWRRTAELAIQRLSRAERAESALSRARELVRMYVAWRMSGQHRGALDEMLAMDRAFAEFLTAAPVDATDPANTPKEPTADGK